MTLISENFSLILFILNSTDPGISMSMITSPGCNELCLAHHIITIIKGATTDKPLPSPSNNSMD